jgi:hypothetical protein
MAFLCMSSESLFLGHFNPWYGAFCVAGPLVQVGGAEELPASGCGVGRLRSCLPVGVAEELPASGCGVGRLRSCLPVGVAEELPASGCG